SSSRREPGHTRDTGGGGGVTGTPCRAPLCRGSAWIRHKMSRRKQTTPNKVHWEQMFAGLEQQARQAMMKTEIIKQESSMMETNDRMSSDSDEDETTIDDLSSPASEEDSADKEEPGASRGKDESRSIPHSLGHLDSVLYLCPLCQLECDSQEQLISHVYQHTAAVVSAKSYLCPVCGRALSSPGSLGRHLLIHSDDQLSNCAVCGAQFSTLATFNSEKLPELLSSDSWNQDNDKTPNGVEGKDEDFNPIYPAGVLLVCNNCVAYRKMVTSQTPRCASGQLAGRTSLWRPECSAWSGNAPPRKAGETAKPPKNER
ncbi:unnamed protein product, partial [Staurois parvus]